MVAGRRWAALWNPFVAACPFFTQVHAYSAIWNLCNWLLYFCFSVGNLCITSWGYLDSYMYLLQMYLNLGRVKIKCSQLTTDIYMKIHWKIIQTHQLTWKIHVNTSQLVPKWNLLRKKKVVCIEKTSAYFYASKAVYSLE